MCDEKKDILTEAIEKRNSNDPPTTPRPEIEPAAQDGSSEAQGSAGDQGSEQQASPPAESGDE